MKYFSPLRIGFAPAVVEACPLSTPPTVTELVVATGGLEVTVLLSPS